MAFNTPGISGARSTKVLMLAQSSQVRLKMYKTPSRERVCEIQSLEGNGSSTQKYIQHQKRRFSEFSASVAASTSALRRRASEMTKPLIEVEVPRSPTAGITCSNTDLISILSSLTSSATEINTCGTEGASGAKDEQKLSWSAKTAEQKRNRLKSSRSNSFDMSILHGTKNKMMTDSSGKSNLTLTSLAAPSNWFAKRHQPISKKGRCLDDESARIFKLDKSRMAKIVKDTLGKVSPTKELDTKHKVIWDDRSGTKVDAQVNYLHSSRYIYAFLQFLSISRKERTFRSRIAYINFKCRERKS